MDLNAHEPRRDVLRTEKSKGKQTNKKSTSDLAKTLLRWRAHEPWAGRNIYKQISDKGLVSRIYRSLYSLIKKKQQQQKSNHAAFKNG